MKMVCSVKMYTSIRNSSDAQLKKREKNQNKAEILPWGEVPKILTYKTQMTFLKNLIHRNVCMVYTGTADSKTFSSAGSRSISESS